MNRSTPLARKLAALVAASSVLAAAQAQTAPTKSTTPPSAPPPLVADDEVTTLTPFEVTASQDRGYAATETLAGTRIRTDLKDVGASISVLTKQFLNDVGATDNSTLLQYTTNAEVAGTRGTYAGVGNAASVSEEDNLRAPQSAQRVRGLAPADNARNFYITDIPWDSYNIDRIDILRGPNSILYGLGSPSGIINAATRNAEFRNFGSVQARTGSYGSVRGTVDVNEQIAPGIMAIRLDGLWDNKKFRQDPAFENDRRLYGAFRIDPQLFKDRSFHTSIKGNLEHGEISANRPRILPPTDAFTPWWRPVAVSATNPFGGMGKATFGNVYDPYRTDNVVAGDGKGTLQSNTVNYQPWASDLVNQQQPFFQIDGANNQLYQAFGGYINNGARNSTGGFTGVSSGLVGKRQSGMLYNVSGYLPGVVTNYSNSNNTLFPDAKYGQYRQLSLQDASIFDFYNKLIDGPNKAEWSSWDSQNIDVTQTAFNDRVGLELTYDRQRFKRGAESFFGWSPALTIDLTQQFADLSANPNFGRPFISGAGGNGGSSYESDRKYYRASLFAELRPADYLHNSFLRKLIGRQRFNGVGADEKFFNESRSWYMYGNTQAWQGFWNGNSGATVGVNDRAPVAAVYLGGSVIGRAAASGANIPSVQTQIALPNAPVRVMDSTWQNNSVGFGDPWNVPASLFPVYNGIPAPGSTTQLTQASNPANYAGWVNNTLDTPLLRSNRGDNLALMKSAQKALRETRSLSGSWQGYFWNNAFVPTLGWRYDEVKNQDVTAKVNTLDRSIPNLTSNQLPNAPAGTNTAYTLEPRLPIKGHSTSGGAVLHLTRLIDRNWLPFNVSLTYNESSNFQVTTARRDVYGNTIGNPTGKTYEYGLLLSTKDNKYSLRVTDFTTRVQNGSSTLGSAGTLGGAIANGLAWRNIFLYQLGGYDWASRNQASYRNTWTNAFPLGSTNVLSKTPYTQAQADADLDAAITGWNDIQKFLDQKGFFKAWNFTPTTTAALVNRTQYLADPTGHAPDPASVAAYQSIYATPQGFSVTADTESKGKEFEFIANPLPNWRISFNASRTIATQKNVGGQTLSEFISFVNSKLINADGSLTPAGALPRFGGVGNAIYPSIWGPWLANYTLLKLQEGSPVPEIRKWRYNIVTSYDFRQGKLKGVGVGGAYRWQDKVIIGYPVVTGGAFASYDLSKPYYGPSESAVDLWASYERKVTRKINWKIQLNVYNVGKRDGLIPISVEPDGHTWAAARIAPTQEWQLTNTFSF